LKHLGVYGVSSFNEQRERRRANAMTIGDVLAVTMGLMLTGAAWAATILLFALAFPGRAAAAQAKLIQSPKRCLAIGLGTVAGAGLLGAICAGSAAGPVKLMAGVIAAGVCLAAALGSAGLVRLLGERITALGAPMTPFASLTRASVLYVLAGFLPGVGWFVLVPAALCLAVGSSVLALFPAPVAVRACPAEIEAAG
jgi:hypothetical protein